VAGKSSAANLNKPADLPGGASGRARFADTSAADAPTDEADAPDAHRKRTEQLQEQRRALESSLRGLQAAGLLAGPARDALQAALDAVAALQLAHRSEKEASLPTKVLHDRACRDRDQAVQKLGRTKDELADTQEQLEVLLKRQEMLQARAKDQTAKVATFTTKVHELGQRLAIETAASTGAAAASSPFTAAGAGFSAPAASPFKRQRPEIEEDDGMGRRSSPSSPLGAHPGAFSGGASAAASAPLATKGGLAPSIGRPADADLFASLGGALATGLPAVAAAVGHTNF
jgi:hypothetical protein